MEKNTQKHLEKNYPRCGVCIISGLANGIDTAAHYGAMKEIGKTIAVLGGGLNNIYPKENIWLYEEILKNNGCVITEYSRNVKTQTSYFPKRNRIISGIADGVLVIEAEHRSGSKITARYAMEQNKKVFCLPGNLDGMRMLGIKELIESGAKFVITPEDLINKAYNEKLKLNNEFDKQYKIESNYKNIKEKEDNVFNNNSFKNEINKLLNIKTNLVPDEYRSIYNILKKSESEPDEISRKLSISIGEVNATLTLMELDGYIIQTPGNIFKIK